MAGSPRRKGRLDRRAADSDFTRRVYLPVQRFIQTEWIGGVLLLAAAVVALVWANSPWSESYHHLWETPIIVDLGVLRVSKDLHHWINDGLMAVFFFVVGLEIKRELLHGNLSNPREAALPAFAAIGGMVVPALVYFALNPEGEAARGWGIPMATDIAFALGVVGLVGRGIPSTVRIFLLALAIVDDLGAILVIAVFYTEAVNVAALLWAAGLLGVVFALQRGGVRALGAYAVVGILFWLAVLESGIHATVAGVILGAVTPSRPFFPPSELQPAAEDLMKRLDEAEEAGSHDVPEALLGEMEELITGTESPLERMERMVHPWSAYFVLPVFALANSGVELSMAGVREALTGSVTLGVILGLLVGKLVGIFSAAWLAVRLGVADRPAGVTWTHIAGAAVLAGIGFTVALFITDLAFSSPAVIDQAKIGILLASLIAGVAGFLLLKLSGESPERGGDGIEAGGA